VSSTQKDFGLQLWKIFVRTRTFNIPWWDPLIKLHLYDCTMRRKHVELISDPTHKRDPNTWILLMLCF